MIRRPLLKCIIFVYIFFVFRKNDVTAKPDRRPKKGTITNYLRSNNQPAKWALDVLRDKVSINELKETEPGFNLTKEEIIRLKIWPQGIIPYYIDDFSFDKVLRDRIRTYLDLTNRATGVRFIELPRPPEDDNTRWVLFVNRQGLLGCADHSTKDFTNKGVQKVILGYDCLVSGGELAEAILALVGVPPQHNAPDRNKYIKIVDTNILQDKKHLFIALGNREWMFHDLPYDFLSASHYSLHKYTRNGFATIELKKHIDEKIGEGKGFSYSDIWKIRMLYNYISNAKKNLVNISDCIKLFEPGNNFTNYKPFLEDIIEPRTKPNKYLSLPDDSLKLKNNGDNNKCDGKSNCTSGEDENAQNSNQDNMSDENHYEQEETDSKEENEIVNKKIDEENSQIEKDSKDNINPQRVYGKQKMQLKGKIRNPFDDLSDYKSWETTRAVNRMFKKAKG